MSTITSKLMVYSFQSQRMFPFMVFQKILRFRCFWTPKQCQCRKWGVQETGVWVYTVAQHPVKWSWLNRLFIRQVPLGVMAPHEYQYRCRSNIQIWTEGAERRQSYGILILTVYQFWKIHDDLRNECTYAPITNYYNHLIIIIIC